MKFRRKQDEVEAVQFVDGRYGEAIDFCPMLTVEFDFTQEKDKPETVRRVIAHARIGESLIDDGDWLVKTADGFEVTTDEDFRVEFEAS